MAEWPVICMWWRKYNYWMKVFAYILFIVSTLVACSSNSQTARDSLKLTPLNDYQYPDFIRIDSSKKSEYPFIQFEDNNYRFYTESSKNWEYLYREFRAMVKGKDCKLNFYHIGGSHLQADIYTHDIRTYLQSNWSNLPGERGLVFPFDLARTNNPWNYEFSSPNSWKSYKSVGKSNPNDADFGLLGAYVETKDSVVEISFKYDKTLVKPGFTRLRVYHNKGKFPYELNFAGDEILVVDRYHNETMGYTETVFTDPVDTFNLQFIRISDEIFPLQIHGVQLSNAKPGISYTAIGINGAGLYTYLGNENFEEQLHESPPDFFAFSVGTNDANVPYESFKPEVYKKNLETLMLKVLNANPNCAILLTVPNDAAFRKQYPNRNVAREREVIIELAKKYECPVWDLYGIMGELASSRTWRDNKLMQADMVHFTAAGYHLKAELFIDAFEKWLEQMADRKPIEKE